MAEEKAKGAAEATAAPKGGEAAEAKPAKKALNKKVLIIAGILIADVAIMVGLGFFIVSKLKGNTADPVAEQAREHEEEEKKKKEMATKIGMVLPKPLPFTVNIAGAPGESHYLKCAIQFEWDGEEAKGGGEGEGGPALDATGKEIQKRMAKITDIIINILSSQAYADLLKPSGKQKIKESIVTEINAILPEPEAEGKHDKDHPAPSGKLRNAFFTEFIVQ
jgi:flagellar basal body-associated protein FliL